MNRLAKETSPYLLQHAHNPVDWFPWGVEALQKAKAENKPVLVSIGYAACHWCHVMERESFENEETAAFMNDHFINIKIDREERPDLDAIYMEAVQLIAGNGGWPLNVFLTPDAKPFYGGTYFPPVQAYNRSSWMDVLESIRSAWEQQPQEILSQAENLTAHIGSSDFLNNIKASQVGESDVLKETTLNLLNHADKQWGGFGKAPKFPQTGSITYLLRHYYFFKDTEKELADEALKQALLSLDKMIFGGIYDQLEGGFARYATDTEWQIPHFEKMLYDNALLVSALSEAYQLTKKPLYKQVIEQTMRFIQNNWVSPEGGFYSAYDADSEGIEGKYYTWEKVEIANILKEKAELFCQYYQVTEKGNWEETNILWCQTSLEEFCVANALDLIETAQNFEIYRQSLLQIRNKRIKPLLDDKILFGWNSLMVSACCKAYMALGNNTYLEMAIRAANFLKEKFKGATGYYHNYKKSAANPAFLDDLAYYTQALIYLQEITADQSYLLAAKECLEGIINHFSDVESPFLYYTANNQQDVIVRKKEWYDGATPAGNSIMIWNLKYLAVVFDKPEWAVRANEMMEQLRPAIIKYPTSFAYAAMGLQQSVSGDYEISLNGRDANRQLREILEIYWPDKIIQTQHTETMGFPLFQNRWPEASDLHIYLCKNQVCQKPVTTTEQLLKVKETFGK
jgi:uncharacterized protein YyaL (SSP411 family)